jgi:hypothetical protein
MRCPRRAWPYTTGENPLTYFRNGAQSLVSPPAFNSSRAKVPRRRGLSVFWGAFRPVSSIPQKFPHRSKNYHAPASDYLMLSP